VLAQRAAEGFDGVRAPRDHQQIFFWLMVTERNREHSAFGGAGRWSAVGREAERAQVQM
jgi:hypothetical protein